VHRIYFDTNEGTDERYDLGLQASINDLAAIPGGPREGLRVVIYMTGELEMEATLEYDGSRSSWMAVPDDSTIKYYDEPGDGDADA
jgi:hypothetical protein